MKSKRDKSKRSDVRVMLSIALSCFSCMLPGELPKEPPPPVHGGCHTVDRIFDCTATNHGLFTSYIGVCAVRTEKGKRISVLRPTMHGDVVCHFRDGFYKVRDQPLVY